MIINSRIQVPIVVGRWRHTTMYLKKKSGCFTPLLAVSDLGAILNHYTMIWLTYSLNLWHQKDFHFAFSHSRMSAVLYEFNIDNNDNETTELVHKMSCNKTNCILHSSFFMYCTYGSMQLCSSHKQSDISKKTLDLTYSEG